jgi:hypothetical protein
VMFGCRGNVGRYPNNEISVINIATLANHTLTIDGHPKLAVPHYPPTKKKTWYIPKKPKVESRERIPQSCFPGRHQPQTASLAL